MQIVEIELMEKETLICNDCRQEFSGARTFYYETNLKPNSQNFRSVTSARCPECYNKWRVRIGL
jgi:predicted  nucleic acid-binding Zn ribbon protein